MMRGVVRTDRHTTTFPSGNTACFVGMLTASYAKIVLFTRGNFSFG